MKLLVPSQMGRNQKSRTTSQPFCNSYCHVTQTVCTYVRTYIRGGPCKATPINYRFVRRSKGRPYPKVACSSSVLLHYTIDVVGMSWPVRYGEVRMYVATLAQEFLEGLSPPTSEMMVFKPRLSNDCYMTTDVFAGL